MKAKTMKMAGKAKKTVAKEVVKGAAKGAAKAVVKGKKVAMKKGMY